MIAIFRYIFFVLVFQLGVAPSILVAQNLKQIEPQKVPESVRPQSPEKEPTSDQFTTLDKDNIPLGVNLKGIAFLSHPGQVVSRGLRFDPNANLPADRLPFSAGPVPLLNDPSFADRLKPFKGVALTLQVIDQLQKEVADFYKSKNHPYVLISIPPQDISSGIVQVLIVESRVGDVQVQGNKWFKEKDYLASFRLKSDDAISGETLKDDIAWINRNPFRNVDVVVAPGEDFGTTDLTLLANDRIPFRIYGGYDNNGPKLSGRDRFLTGFNWGNAFGLGHEFNYQHVRSLPSKHSKGHSGSYVIPLPWRHLFSISGAYSKTDPDLPAPFNASGKSWMVEAGYVVPLKSTQTYSHEISVRIPFKSSDNTLVFSQVPITDNETHILQLELGYSGVWDSTLGKLGFYTTLVGSPGGLTSRNEGQFFQVSRSGADSDYVVGRAGVTFATSLPLGFRWSSTMDGQWASENLLGSEQFGLAGVQAVRGYDQGLVFRDNGFLMRNELIAPGFSIHGDNANYKAFAKKHNVPRDSFHLLAFIDYGFGGNVTLLPGEDGSINLASTGVGLRYLFGPFLSVNIDYGWQLSSEPIDGNSGQLHASIIFGY